MSIDKFFSRSYNVNTYNCAHFVTEVWEHLTGKDISHIMYGFLRPEKERFAKNELRHSFEALKEPSSPCIVLMRRRKFPPHVGVFYNNKVFQITRNGVEYLPLEVARRGYDKIRFYSC